MGFAHLCVHKTRGRSASTRAITSTTMIMSIVRRLARLPILVSPPWMMRAGSAPGPRPIQYTIVPVECQSNRAYVSRLHLRPWWGWGGIPSLLGQVLPSNGQPALSKLGVPATPAVAAGPWRLRGSSASGRTALESQARATRAAMQEQGSSIVSAAIAGPS